MTIYNNHIYASLGRRFTALVIDFVALSILFFPVTRIVKGVWLMTGADHKWEYGWFITDPLCLIFLLVIFLYFVLLEGLLGATIGKKMAGVKIITADGNKPGIGKSLIRNILRIVDSLPAFNILGVYLILTTPEKMRFGDRISGTRVIKS